MTTHNAPLIALVGDYDAEETAHDKITEALSGLGVRYRWHPTDSLTGPGDIADADGIWVVPGSPYRSMAGALTAIRFAREEGIPYLGTCGGFQHALIEWARNVLGLAAAQDVQSAPDGHILLITPLACAMRGEHRPLRLAADSKLAAIYGQLSSTELYHCSFGMNPQLAGLFTHCDLRIVAWDETGAPRAVELRGHPFFVGTLYQPELSSDRDQQHTLIHAFAGAVRQRQGGSQGQGQRELESTTINIDAHAY
ncbi:MAG TPA: hypothetical protein VFI65_08295 [Streptosporangiaceae bacterium]|nr:hypothetical protein [Streptosporangiaceae bacterium]